MNRRQEPEPTDAEIEAIVAGAIVAEAARAQVEATPPSSAVVWWRAQMRARREAARAADRPITILHALAIACGVGLAVSLMGTAFAGVRQSIRGLPAGHHSLLSMLAPLASIDPASRRGML